jgi:Lar family restriction alleviation protein
MFDPQPQMTDLPAEKQAAKAIAHTLRNISERPSVAWYLGHGTQTYALLTEAHATLHGITMEKAQENWPPADQPQFDSQNLNNCPFCGNGRLEIFDEDEMHFVKCKDCNSAGPAVQEFLHDSRLHAMSAAVRKWNERQMPR